MFSSNQRFKRKRGVILSAEGWYRLQSAQKQSEATSHGGMSYTLEELNILTGLSPHTLTKVKRRQAPVDRQTLAQYFKAFELVLCAEDYIRPLPDVSVPLKKEDSANSTDKTNSDLPLDGDVTENREISLSSEPTLPEGQVPLDSSFYISRSPVEENCYKAILQPGALIRIKAPRRMGKSSLMARIMYYAAQQGYQTVFLSFQLAERDILKDLDRFLQWFSSSISLAMNLPNQVADYWDDVFGSKISCKIYFEQHLLTRISNSFVLVLDDIDRLFDYPELADEFFSLLRTWHEQAKNNNIWQKLRLVVGHSTEVYIPLNVNQSPFNVGLPIELAPFTDEQIAELAHKYGLNWSQNQTERLMNLVEGQPYLAQLTLYTLWRHETTLDEILAQATTDEGIFSNHLLRQWWTIHQNSELELAFAKVVKATEPIELELSQAFKLKSLGLVKLHGNQAIPSCDLYGDYFRDRLSI